jgi:hypothetical protein
VIDWKALALAAARANAAYIEDRNAAQAAFSALGDTFIDQYKNGTHQAVLSFATQDRVQLSISGTRGLSLSALDLFDDIDLTPALASLNGHAAAGAIEGLEAMWNWVDTILPPECLLDVQGHSLGAARTHMTPLFCLPEVIGNLYSFESPKFLDAAFYADCADVLDKMVCTLNGRDPWAAWPWCPHGYVRPPLPHIWLSPAGYATTIAPDDWPGGELLRFTDHDMAPIAALLARLAA